MNPIWYIHGASSTARSFNYIKSELPVHEFEDIEYTHAHPVTRVVDAVVARLESSPVPVTLIGHSLGGVIAVAASQRSQNVRNVVTMASPFGGSQVASLMRWISPSQLLDDIHPHSPLIRAVKRAKNRVHIMSIVTTGGGISLISGENDGVVTTESQTSILGPVYLRVPVNHFEVLLCRESVELIAGHLFA
ncbi:MAG: alpha/beta fold hydrolase [Verrucomicrobiaceae bacterium]|nr:MAG: alpha/beta fold hydrolase [Verrucomicrobiaceae bacterium]